MNFALFNSPRYEKLKGVSMLRTENFDVETLPVSDSTGCDVFRGKSSREELI